VAASRPSSSARAPLRCGTAALPRPRACPLAEAADAAGGLLLVFVGLEAQRRGGDAHHIGLAGHHDAHLRRHAGLEQLSSLLSTATTMG
jgi:hypothetical protein